MNYELEVNNREEGSHIVFNTITLNSFKVNIVERYSEKAKFNPRLCEVHFKVRTLDDQIIEKKDGNVNMYIRGEEFDKYINFKNILQSPYYKKKIINPKKAEEDFVHFILTKVVMNYELN